jgi:hypothetical protein
MIVLGASVSASSKIDEIISLFGRPSVMAFVFLIFHLIGLAILVIVMGLPIVNGDRAGENIWGVNSFC